MSTLVLVGDSVFDNASYVNGPDVRAQVETKMPDDWAVSLLAVDGSYILDVPNQLTNRLSINGFRRPDGDHFVIQGFHRSQHIVALPPTGGSNEQSPKTPYHPQKRRDVDLFEPPPTGEEAHFLKNPIGVADRIFLEFPQSFDSEVPTSS